MSDTNKYQARSSLLQQSLQQQQKRQKHHIGRLDYEDTFSRHGVPGLLSPAGFQIAWTEYQRLLVNKLNDLTANDETYNWKPKQIVTTYARDPMNASLFNHASMVHNNHFFFSALSTKALELNKQPLLKQDLERAFGSIDTLRTVMLDTAAAMFGPGFVWLVWAKDRGSASQRGGDWRILATYNAGTPYPEAGFRAQGIDMNTSNAGTFNDYFKTQPTNNAGHFGPHSSSGKLDASTPPGSTQIVPVLCVNTWEHVYLYDYGVQGKRKYLADWWDVVDWAFVDNMAPLKAQQNYMGSYRR